MNRREFIITGGIVSTFATVPLPPFLTRNINPQSKNIYPMNDMNIVTRKSPYTVKETMDKFEAILTQKTITVYARIDQQQEAAKAGIKLNALEFILFGSPKKGGLVMAENPVAALELPLKVLVWEDKQREVWVTYNDPKNIEQRFSLKSESAKLTDLEPIITELLKNRTN